MKRYKFVSNISKISTRPRISQLYDFDTTKKILDLMHIPYECEKNIRITNSFSCKLKDYIILHYYDPHPLVYNVRGIVVEINSLKIMCRSFPFTPEYDISNSFYKFEIDLVLDDLKNYRITKAYEGTILRLWYNEEKDVWMLSTHVKIDGRKCKWSGDEFGNMFDKLWEAEDYNILKKDKTYIFLLSHKNNKVVCLNENKLYYLGSATSQSDGTYSSVCDFEPLEVKSKNIIFQEEFEGMTKNDIVRDLSDNFDRKYTGFLFQHKTTGKCIKLVSPHYVKYKNLRGDVPNINRRFVFILLEENKEKITEFRKVCSESELENLTKIEAQIEIMPKVMYGWYNYRYVQNKFLQLTQDAHSLIKRSKELIENRGITYKDEVDMLNIFKFVMKKYPKETFAILISYRNQINDNLKNK